MEDPPSHPGVAPHAGPPVGQWGPGYSAHSAPQAPRSRVWPAIAIVGFEYHNQVGRPYL